MSATNAMSAISAIKRTLYPIYRNYFSRAYLYEGTLKSGNGSVKCLFVDNDKFYLSVLHALFAESPTLVRTFRCWIPSLKWLIKSPGLDADICFANVPLRYDPLFRDSATYIMQTRVRKTAAIGASLESNKRYRDKRKRVVKKIKKYGLTSKISRYQDDFDYFYHRMSLPLVKKFGDASIVDTYEEMRRIFEKGVLILVLYNEKRISAALCYENNGTLVYYRSGLLDGEQTYLDMGAMSATYFFLFEYACQQGYQKIDFMRCLPFLNDGVYMHKQEWGATTEPFEGATSWVYLFNRGSSETLARVVKNIPLIVHTNNGLEGVVTVPDEHDLTPELEQKLSSQYSAPGLYGLQVLRSNGTIEQIILNSHNG